MEIEKQKPITAFALANEDPCTARYNLSAITDRFRTDINLCSTGINPVETGNSRQAVADLANWAIPVSTN